MRSIKGAREASTLCRCRHAFQVQTSSYFWPQKTNVLRGSVQLCSAFVCECARLLTMTTAKRIIQGMVTVFGSASRFRCLAFVTTCASASTAAPSFSWQTNHPHCRQGCMLLCGSKEHSKVFFMTLTQETRRSSSKHGSFQRASRQASACADANPNVPAWWFDG